MKKIFLISLVLVLLLTLTACTSKKDNGVNSGTQTSTDGTSSNDELLIYDSTDLYVYEDYKDGITITRFKNYNLIEYDKIIIPSEINGKKVLGIGSLEKKIQAMTYVAGNCEVVIPETVEFIGDYAFFDADGLVKVSGGANVKIVGSGAFGYCEKLEEVTFINNVDYVDEYAFDGSSFKYK